MISASHWDAKLLDAYDECPGVRTFRLTAPDGFHFLPGMWVMLHFPDAPKAARAYSIASSPLEKGHIEITMGQVGDFSARFFDLKPGDSIAAKGPYGKWVFTENIKRAALVSGGTGITPFRSMARYAIAKGRHKGLSLFYSSKTPLDAIYKHELAEFSRAGIKVHHTITRAAGERWDGPTGRITTQLLESALENFTSTHFFLCGPTKLVSDLVAGLRSRGIPEEQLHHEMWGDYQL